MTVSQVAPSSPLALREISSSRTHTSFSSEETLTLSQLSMHANTGELVALLGESGVGKTSLLRLILGLDPLLSGEIFWEGRLLQSGGEHIPVEERKFAYSPQEPRLFPHLHVIDNILFGIQDLSKAIQSERLEWVLSLVSLEHQKFHWPYQLSGGQQKRVSLARALVLNARLLLLDEPFSSLDQSLRLKLQTRIFKALSDRNTTVIWSTHHIDDALQYADRLWLLDRPDSLIDGDPQSVYTTPPSPRVAEFLGPVDWLSSLYLTTWDYSWTPYISSVLTIKDQHTLCVGLRPDQWVLLSDSFVDTLSLQKKPSLLGKVSNISKQVKLQSLTIEPIHPLQIDLSYSDLPISVSIRITLPSHLPIIIDQVVRVRYLGVAIFVKCSKEKS
jgi:iron(III) transport system ATP-binding protein